MRIKIGIPIPTAADLEYNGQNWSRYAAAVQGAGAEACQLALDLPTAELQRSLETCHGFVLPGSPADVDPAKYGQAKESATAAEDSKREALDRAILEHAAATGKPVLAICFGLQFLNVWNGGTLVQDLQPVPVNHSAGSSVAVAHAALVSRESLLAGLLTTAEAPADRDFRRLPVNSSHHQAVGIPGDDLAIVARSAQDGVIEALEGRIGAAAIVGVQWHPERTTDISPASRALFTWLVSEAEDQQNAAQEVLDARAL